jgi:DNA-binding NarL/FixJ family response regulator
MAITVLLAEDHTLVRDGLRILLDSQDDLEIVGEASDGPRAVQLVRKLKPDVAVLDLTMPSLNGIEATRQIRAAEVPTRVLILTMHRDRRYLFESLRAGASGYLIKDAAFAELVTAIRTVAGGQTYLSPAVADLVMDDYVLRARGEEEGGDLERLSGREREILRLIAEGKSSIEIGRILHISNHTVDTHRRNLMVKLDIHTLAGLVKFAVRHGVSGLE